MECSGPAIARDADLPLRPAATVMDLQRLGCLYQYRLSFMRTLVRRIMNQQWRIDRRTFDLDDNGFGTALYEINTPTGIYSFVVFASYLDPSRRSDRVIADAWDMTVSLCEGRIDSSRLEQLRANVPLQEEGRMDSSCLVLSRANKSVRNFDYVVDMLASGQQPSLAAVARVGYLYRTTAVYGSGKFGMADWDKVRERYTDFARPFAAEMFTCYLIRQFSLDQADFLAARRTPETAARMDDTIKRYVGIGNATGLGMAPYLINHPLLISRWIEVRETALARVIRDGEPDARRLSEFDTLARRAIRHLEEIETDNEDQNAINRRARTEMSRLLQWLADRTEPIHSWQELSRYAEENAGVEAQELLNTLLIELYPKLVEDLEDALCIREQYRLTPEMPLAKLRAVIKSTYAWALTADAECESTFWYRSEEKMEPRLGQREVDPGADREMAIGVARSVRQCYEAICDYDSKMPEASVARFLFAHPRFRKIVRRVQTMATTYYGDIQANLLAIDVLPIHLLRCKLSFFGVGKFDPKSRLWVRNTMFQGAPVVSDIGAPFADDWCFPVMPVVESQSERAGH